MPALSRLPLTIMLQTVASPVLPFGTITSPSISPPLATATRSLTQSPASKAGLKGSDNTVTVDGRSVDVGGDVITALNGQPIYSFDDLLIYIALNTSPGQQATLTIVRNGSYQDVKVRLEPRPQTVP